MATGNTPFAPMGATSQFGDTKSVSNMPAAPSQSTLANNMYEAAERVRELEHRIWTLVDRMVGAAPCEAISGEGLGSPGFLGECADTAASISGCSRRAAAHLDRLEKALP